VHGVTDVRVRLAIVNLHKEGKTYTEVARLLSVGEATVSRVLRRHRESGTVDPRPRGGGNFSRIKAELAETLKHLVDKQPDSTCDELAERFFDATGVRVSRSAVTRALRRFGYTQKKRPLPRWSASRKNTANREKSS
jgi:transposase